MNKLLENVAIAAAMGTAYALTICGVMHIAENWDEIKEKFRVKKKTKNIEIDMKDFQT